MANLHVHLAQLNIALPREPLDAPLMAEFVAAPDPVMPQPKQRPASSGGYRPSPATRRRSVRSVTIA
jgi:hypothetical protein